MRGYKEYEARPSREERIIIYATKTTKQRWQKAVVDMEVRNYEEALNKLMDLYVLSSRYLQLSRIDDIIRRLHEILGTSVRFRVAPA